jgi:hypothetical protein
MTNVNYHGKEKGTSDEHYTPKSIFDALGVQFDLDVAAPKGGSNVVPALNYYDKKVDGLASEWFGNVWMNPPYSSPAAWVDKFLNHKQGIALLPITRGKWWDRLWAEADAILPTVYNLKFNRPDGLAAKPIVFRTALYALGESNVTALKMSGLGRIR